MAQRETLNTRVTRLEELAQMVPDAQVKTEQRFQELRQESADRQKRLDERIDSLITAIRKAAPNPQT